MQTKRKPYRLSGLQELRHWAAQQEQFHAAKHINRAGQAEYRAEEERRRRVAGEQVYATGIGKSVMARVKHEMVEALVKHAERAVGMTVNRSIEKGDYYVRIRIPELVFEHVIYKDDLLVDAVIERRFGTQLAGGQYAKRVDIDTERG